ncbi:MAG: hypothetical protein E3J96_06680 [Sulfurovum sp.]|nr:MAG: hypothetical protein E3J96_06680 [Sulfurovum sp.]
MYLQDDNNFAVPLSLDLRHPSISFSYGKEFSDKSGRHLENYQLSFGADWKKHLLSINILP